MLDAFLDWLTRLPPGPTYAVLAALSALENVFPPLPADVAVAIGAFLAQRGEVSAPLLGLVCWLANTATAPGMYVLGRVKGDDFFHRGWGRRLLPPEAMAALHAEPNAVNPKGTKRDEAVNRKHKKARKR